MIMTNLQAALRRRHPHRSPDEDCRCGFYAFNDRRVNLEMAFFMHAGNVVAGSIKGYGRTLIGDAGFRCEKAVITKLMVSSYMASFDPEMVRRLRRNYPGIELTVDNSNPPVWTISSG
jgi:hypothetical protein